MPPPLLSWHGTHPRPARFFGVVTASFPATASRGQGLPADILEISPAHHGGPAEAPGPRSLRARRTWKDDSSHEAPRRSRAPLAVGPGEPAGAHDPCAKAHSADRRVWRA